MFNFFGTAADKAFASELAERLRKVLPPDTVLSERKGATVNRISRLLEGTYDSAAAYQGEQRLGMFRRAALANHFKWELKTFGYPDKFIEVATEGLVIELMKASRSKSKAPTAGPR